VLLLGFATGLLPRARIGRLSALALAGLAALALVTVFALSWTESDERTVTELARVLHHLGLLVLVLALIDPITWRPAAAGLTAGAVLVSLAALASRLAPGLFPVDAVNRIYSSNRLNYPLGYWNAIAAWSAMAATLAVGWSAQARSVAGRALALAPVPAIMGATYLCYSRGGVIAVAAGLIALLVLAPARGVVLVHAAVAAAGSALVIEVIRAEPEIALNTGTAGAARVLAFVLLGAALCAAVAAATGALELERHLRLPRRAALPAAAATAVLLVIAGIVAGPGLVDRGLDSLRAPPPAVSADDPAQRLRSLSSARYQHWRAALDSYSDEKLHGTGPGTFEFSWDRSRHYTGFVRDAHSLYLELLAETGWLGLLSGLLFVAGTLAAGARALFVLRGRPEAGIVASLLAAWCVFVVFAGFDWAWEATALAALGLAAAALAMAATASAATRRTRLPVRVALALLALVIGLTQLPGLVSTSKLRSSQAAVRTGDLGQALAEAEDAIASAPWAATPFVQRALILERADRLPRARADLLRAREREPTNYRHPLLLSRVEAELGRPAAAVTAYRAARALAPRKAVFGDTALPPAQPEEP
jgi:tetratricopeptide (TPR) repeat protein